MTTTTCTATATKAVEQARAEVLAARVTLEEWEAKQAAATADLEALEQLAGDQILDDPSAADEVEARAAAAQAAQRVAARAVAAQRPRLLAAESQYFAAEADALAEKVTAARAVLDKHVATTAQLLKKLEQHEHCGYVPEAQGRSEGMRGEVRRLEDQVTLVRELAAGRDPDAWVRAHRWSIITGATAALPEHLCGAAALVPTEAYLARAAAARARLDELELLREELPAKLEDRADQVRLRAPDVDLADDFVWAQLKARLDGIDAEIDEARGALAGILHGAAGPSGPSTR